MTQRRIFALPLFLLLLATLLTGCAKLKQEIWIHQDGTAKLYAELSIKTDQGMSAAAENPFRQLVDSSDPNLVNLKIDQFQEAGYWNFFAEFEVKSFEQFVQRGNFALAKLTHNKGSSGGNVLTLVSAPPNPDDMAGVELLIQDQFFTAIIHAPYVLTTNGQVSGQDAVSTTVQWQIPLADALVNPGKQSFSVEYTLEKPAVVPTHQVVKDGATATPSATKPKSATVATPTPKATSLTNTIRYDSPLLRTIAANPPTFTDDFSQNDGRWQAYTNEQVKMGIEKGAFAMIAQKGDFAFWTSAQAELSDFLMEVDTTIPHSDYEFYTGVIFRFVDNANFYVFYISTKGEYTVMKMVNNEWQVVSKLKQSKAIKLGNNAHNLLSVAAIGEDFQIAINGTLVEKFTDQTLDHGDIGFAISSATKGNITLTFDNFKFWNIRQLSPEARLAVMGRKLSDLSLEELLDLADEYYFHDSLDNAFTAYNETLKQYPKSEAAYVGRGNSYRLQDKYDEAMKDFEQALKLNSSYAPAYRGIGAIYDTKEDPFKALENINKAIELDRNYSLAYYHRGLIYWEQNSLDAALADYSRAIEIDPTNSKLYYHRGRFYAAQENQFAAMADFNKAIALYPQDASYYWERAELYYKNKDYQSSMTDYNKAIALNPRSALFYWARADSFYYMQNYQLARISFDQAIQHEPENENLYNGRGRAYAALKNYRTSIDDYNKAIQLSPTYGLPYYNRAIAYEELGDQQKAYDDYLKYLELDEDDNYETRHACQQANWLHFTLSENLGSAIFNAFVQPCNRFPTESASQSSFPQDKEQPYSCDCISKEVFDGYNLLGEAVYRNELECFDNNGSRC